jgi:hypothetical protein
LDSLEDGQLVSRLVSVEEKTQNSPVWNMTALFHQSADNPPERQQTLVDHTGLSGAFVDGSRSSNGF